MNPQMQYGGDVIQRANYALEHGTEDAEQVRVYER